MICIDKRHGSDSFRGQQVRQNRNVPGIKRSHGPRQPDVITTKGHQTPVEMEAGMTTVPSQKPKEHSTPHLPVEVRLNIWQHALYEPTRVVILGLSLVSAVEMVNNDQKNMPWLPVEGCFTISTNMYRSSKVSLEPSWPTQSQRTIRTLSLVCVEAREEVRRMFPDLIHASACLLPKQKRDEYTLRCNLKEDIFFLDPHDDIRLPVQSDFFTLLMFHPRFLRQRLARRRCFLPNETQEQEGEDDVNAARSDEFRKSLRSMRKMALGTFLKQQHPLAAGGHQTAIGSVGPIPNLLPWLCNLEIIYYLPPHVFFGDQEITTVQLRRDDTWRLSSGSSHQWTNPHNYIHLHKAQAVVCRENRNSRYYGMHPRHDISATDLVRQTREAEAKGVWARDERFMNFTRLDVSGSHYGEFLHNGITTSERKRDAAQKKGFLPSAGLLMPGPSFTGVNVDLTKVSRGRRPGVDGEEEDWAGIDMPDLFEERGHLDLLDSDALGKRDDPVPAHLPQHMRYGRPGNRSERTYAGDYENVYRWGP